MIEKDEEKIKEFVTEQIENINRGMFRTGEISVSTKDITEQGWKANEISFDNEISLEHFPPMINYYISTFEGSFDDELDYEVDVDSDVFDVYAEDFSTEISNEIYNLLESHITERVEHYPDDYEKFSDFVEIEKVKDQNLKSQLKGLKKRLFPDD